MNPPPDDSLFPSPLHWSWERSPDLRQCTTEVTVGVSVVPYAAKRLPGSLLVSCFKINMKKIEALERRGENSA